MKPKKSYKDRTYTPGPVEQYACPMCHWWRTVRYGTGRSGETREVRFDKIDVVNAPMWRRDRVGGGQIERLESKRLVELPDDIKDQIRRQCRAILKELGE